jgi:hypothetical protein
LTNNDSYSGEQRESSFSTRKDYIVENLEEILENNQKIKYGKYSILNWIRVNYWSKLSENRQQKAQVFYILNGTFDYLLIEIILALAFMEYAFKSANGDIGLTIIELAFISAIFFAVSVCSLIFLFFWPLGDLYFISTNLFLSQLLVYFFIRLIISLILIKFYIHKFFE